MVQGCPGFEFSPILIPFVSIGKRHLMEHCIAHYLYDFLLHFRWLFVTESVYQLCCRKTLFSLAVPLLIFGQYMVFNSCVLAVAAAVLLARGKFPCLQYWSILHDRKLRIHLERGTLPPTNCCASLSGIGEGQGNVHWVAPWKR